MSQIHITKYAKVFFMQLFSFFNCPQSLLIFFSYPRLPASPLGSKVFWCSFCLFVSLFLCCFVFGFSFFPAIPYFPQRNWFCFYFYHSMKSLFFSGDRFFCFLLDFIFIAMAYFWAGIWLRCFLCWVLNHQQKYIEV